MSSQQQRLEDGTPYVGQLGGLAYDPDEDKAQCHLCGGWTAHRQFAPAPRARMDARCLP